MYCKNCGKEIKDDATFCPYCGEPVKSNQGSTSSDAGYSYASEDDNVMDGTYTTIPEEPDANNQAQNGNQGQEQYAKYNSVPNYNSQTQNTRWSATCPKCGGHNITYQTVVEAKKTGCGTILLYIILCCTILGILIVIPLAMRKKTVTVTYAVCQDCGYRWVVKKS